MINKFSHSSSLLLLRKKINPDYRFFLLKKSINITKSNYSFDRVTKFYIYIYIYNIHYKIERQKSNILKKKIGWIDIKLNVSIYS